MPTLAAVIVCVSVLVTNMLFTTYLWSLFILQENYGVVNSPQRLTTHHYTIAPSPLNTIQSTNGCRPPSSSRYRTPSPTLLLEEVGGLRLNDHNEVRRCLFPESLRENNDCHSDPYEGSENVDCYTATIGKKTNRNRLKRL